MSAPGIRIILIETSHPGNIGATARAMKTMGLRELYLVKPKIFPDGKATAMAAGADDLLANAIICDNLQTALEGSQLILATSARPRGLSLPGVTPSEAAKIIAKDYRKSNVAIIFGREYAGLTNEEILNCHYHIQIPTNFEYSSLNLAQAVQIICYELHIQLIKMPITVGYNEDSIACHEDVQRFYAHLKTVLQDINFLKEDNPRRLFPRIMRMFQRIKLETLEVNLLRGMLSQIQKKILTTKANEQMYENDT